MTISGIGNVHNHNVPDRMFLDDDLFDFAKNKCAYCNEPITTEQKYALLKMLISKQADMKIKRNRVGLRTENTIMNHNIKKWAAEGVYKGWKDDIVFEDDILKEKYKFEGRGLTGQNLRSITKLIKDNNLGVERLSHLADQPAGHTVQSILNKDPTYEGNDGKLQVKSLEQKSCESGD